LKIHSKLKSHRFSPKSHRCLDTFPAVKNKIEPGRKLRKEKFSMKKSFGSGRRLISRTARLSVRCCRTLTAARGAGNRTNGKSGGGFTFFSCRI
jgi:hypothetical protein